MPQACLCRHHGRMGTEPQDERRGYTLIADPALLHEGGLVGRRNVWGGCRRCRCWGCCRGWCRGRPGAPGHRLLLQPLPEGLHRGGTPFGCYNCSPSLPSLTCWVP